MDADASEKTDERIFMSAKPLDYSGGTIKMNLITTFFLSFHTLFPPPSNIPINPCVIPALTFKTNA
jgi:hypothetical protein